MIIFEGRKQVVYQNLKNKFQNSGHLQETRSSNSAIAEFTYTCVAKTLLVVCLFLLTTKGYSQLLFKLESDSLKVFSYSGGDEFNNASLNTEEWKDCQWPTINMAQEFIYSSANVKLDDGLVVFAMTKKDTVYRFNPLELDSSFLRKEKISLPDQNYLFRYAAGSIISKKKWHYGFYELKFKVEEGKGVWPAFWFFGGNKNEEIDVFELKGERNDEIHVDTHCPDGCDRGYKNKLGFNANWGGWLPVSDYLHNGFNLMQLEWSADGIIWYVNGYPLAWFKGNLPNPMNIYINTQVAKDGRAFKPGPDEQTKFPNYFYVDYLRVWNKSEEEIPTLSKQEFRESDKFVSKFETKPVRKRGLMFSKKKLNNTGIIQMNYAPDGTLHLRVSGELLYSLSELEIRDKSGNGVLKNFVKEQTVSLPPGDYELVVKNGKKIYNRKFRILNYGV